MSLIIAQSNPSMCLSFSFPSFLLSFPPLPSSPFSVPFHYFLLFPSPALLTFQAPFLPCLLFSPPCTGPLRVLQCCSYWLHILDNPDASLPEAISKDTC